MMMNDDDNDGDNDDDDVQECWRKQSSITLLIL